MWQVDLRHADEKKNSPVVDIGIDLSEFYQSVEWDILEVPAERYVGIFFLLLVSIYNSMCEILGTKNSCNLY
jgi:hypothetical protein